jgi:hypothetical protein
MGTIRSGKPSHLWGVVYLFGRNERRCQSASVQCAPDNPTAAVEHSGMNHGGLGAGSLQSVGVSLSWSKVSAQGPGVACRLQHPSFARLPFDDVCHVIGRQSYASLWSDHQATRPCDLSDLPQAL